MTLSTSSINMLSAHGSHKPTFSPLSISDTSYYDDGAPVIRMRSTSRDSLSGSMNNLSSSYAHLQGVEITKQAQYDAGIVKIWSGEPQHRLSQCVFGQDKNFFPEPKFTEMDLFNPVRYLQMQTNASLLDVSVMTFPIVTGDNDQLENYNFNGVIEPLSIRSIASFFSIEVPFHAHDVRGAMMAGNTNQLNGSDRILTVDYYEPDKQIIGYLDMVDIIEGHPLNGYFQHEFTTNLPFVDARLVHNRQLTINDAEITNVMSLMTGSTDGYVKHNQRSATCGWYYDNNSSTGTDSLSFGGMTY